MTTLHQTVAMQSLIDSLKKICADQGTTKTYWVAFSGGLDSTVLLHLLIQLRSIIPIFLKAVHVHHGLSINANSWVTHCQTFCETFDVELVTHYVNANKINPDQSPEDVARQSRYHALAESMSANDLLFTAHHQDDQAETLLLQLVRGAGPKGLAGMPQISKFFHGFQLRPLLDCSRQFLKNYAEQNNLSWIEDESNTDIKFTRNFIRHQVMPLLQSRWPTVSESLARSAKHCAETQNLLEEFIRQDLLTCQGTKPQTLSVKKLLTFNDAKQRQLLRLWFNDLSIAIPSTIKLKHILNDVLLAREDKLPQVNWGNFEVRRYRDDLYVMLSLKKWIDIPENKMWDLSTPFALPDMSELHCTKVVGDMMSVGFRKYNPTCQLPGRQHHHSLIKLFQEWGVPPWLRDRVPLLFLNGRLIAVVGFFIVERLGFNFYIKSKDGSQPEHGMT